jgi:hypothetical protein
MRTPFQAFEPLLSGLFVGRADIVSSQTLKPDDSWVYSASVTSPQILSSL